MHKLLSLNGVRLSLLEAQNVLRHLVNIDTDHTTAQNFIKATKQSQVVALTVSSPSPPPLSSPPDVYDDSCIKKEMYSQLSLLLFFSETGNLRRGSRERSPPKKTLSGSGGGVEINEEKTTTTSQIDIFDCVGSYIRRQAYLPSYGCGKQPIIILVIHIFFPVPP